MQDHSATQETLRQFAEGFDFEPPVRMLSDLTPEQALARPEGWPYSIAVNVAHMLYWQQLWLDGINEKPVERAKGKNADWPLITAEEWDSTRAALLDGIEQARRKSQNAADLNRTLAYGMTVGQTLLRIALHNSYHVGQIALMRQQLGTWPPAGGDDSW